LQEKIGTLNKKTGKYQEKEKIRAK